MPERVTFDSGGDTCVGYLYGDSGPTPRPCVVLCTGFGGTQDTPSIIATAQAFADHGYRALSFDYRNFGESGGEPRQLVDISGQLDDIHAAVEFARRLDGVDPARIVLWGTSLGGGHVVMAAAHDPRVAAVIAQVPFNGFPKRGEGRSATATARLLWAMTADTIRGKLHLSPRYIPAVAGPGQFAVMSSRGAQHAIDGMTSPTWRNSVAPRALFAMMRYKPGDHAPRVVAPVLVCIGERDRETLADTAAELAQRAPHGELLTYPWAHFDFYREDRRQRVTGDQIAFADRVLHRG
ncbi:MAG TPA: alpha/beta fold hydrolase [Mycobacterium sp.]